MLKSDVFCVLLLQDPANKLSKSDWILCFNYHCSFDPPGPMSAGMSCKVGVTFKPMVRMIQIMKDINKIKQTYRGGGKSQQILHSCFLGLLDKWRSWRRSHLLIPYWLLFDPVKMFNKEMCGKSSSHLVFGWGNSVPGYRNENGMWVGEEAYHFF